MCIELFKLLFCCEKERVNFIVELCTFLATEALNNGVARAGDGGIFPFYDENGFKLLRKTRTR